MVTFTILLVVLWVFMTVSWMTARNTKDEQFKFATGLVAVLSGLILFIVFICGVNGFQTEVQYEEVTRNFTKAKSEDGKYVVIFFNDTNWVYNDPNVISNYNSIDHITYVWSNYPFNSDETKFDIQIYSPVASMNDVPGDQAKHLNKVLKATKLARETADNLNKRMMAREEEVKNIIAARESAQTGFTINTNKIKRAAVLTVEERLTQRELKVQRIIAERNTKVQNNVVDIKNEKH